MASFDVRADGGRNRLYVTLHGFLDEEETAQYLQTVEAELGRLKPGFVLVSTIPDLKATTAGATSALREMMQAHVRHGIGRIVRIVDAAEIERMQLEGVTQELGVPVRYVSSMAQAEELLESR